MTANNSKPYSGYINKLVDEYNITCHRSIGKKAIVSDYSTLTKEIESNHKAPKFEVSDRVRITKSKILLWMAVPIIGQNKCLWIIPCWKLVLEYIEWKI